MKNLLTQWETEEENRKIDDNVLLIDREHSGNILLIDSKHSGNVLLIDSKHNGDVLLIDKELAKLENDTECAFFPKFTKLVKKPFNLTRTRIEKSYRPISQSLACFVGFVEWLCFCFAKDLTDLADGLAMGGAKLRRGEIAIGFSG